MKRINRKSIIEPERKIPVSGDFDVVVLGGGPAGICAAVAAAKQGVSVLLVEKNGYLGGAATAGLVCLWHSLYSMDRKRKIAGGVIDDILKELKDRGALYYYHNGDTRENIAFSPEDAKIVFDCICLENGVSLLFHTYLAGVIKESDSVIKAAIIENKSGRSAVMGRTFIDATGDGDVGWHAGAKFEKGDAQGRMQPPGLCVRLGNLRFDVQGAVSPAQVLKNRKMDYNGMPYTAYIWGVKDVHRRDDSMMLAAARIINTDCTDARQFSEAEIEGRRQADWVFRTLKKELPGFEDACIVSLAPEVYARETRRFVGDYTITEEDILTGRKFDDVIGRGTSDIDVHTPDRKGIVIKSLNGEQHILDECDNLKSEMWTSDGKGRDTQYYEIPYSILLPMGMDNLMVAGRCISADRGALGALRIMVNCMQSGQAAGVGAASASSLGISPRRVDIREVQTRLKKLGMP